ncbi:MAG: transglutaminase-like domain-containing protein [Anaerolineales bacterium]
MIDPIALTGRFLRWFVRFVGAPTLARLVLLSLVLLSVESGLTAVVGHIYPDWLPSTVVYAVLIGWLLGRSRLSGWASGLAALAIGLVWLILSVGQISDPLDTLLPALPPILKSIIFRIPPDVVPLLVAWSTFTQSVAGLASRFMLWFRNAGSSTLIIDPGITSLVWGLALWAVSLWAAWWERRREALGIGLLPATVLLIYNVYYTNSRNGIVWLVLTGGGWIVLYALDSYLKARRRWQEQRMDQTEIEPLLAGTIVLLATGLMLAGGLLPSISIQKISDTLQHIFQSQPDKTLAESLGLQQTPVEIPQSVNAGGIGLSDIHAIGPGPQLSQEVLMYVSVDGFHPPPPDVLLHTNAAQPAVRYYWRAQTYDFYNGHAWIDSTAQIQAIAANSPYHPGLATLPKDDQLVRQHVTRLLPMDGILFVTGDLLSADQPSVAAWRASGDLIDAQTKAETFTADSRIPYVSVEQLRAAGKKYPQSIRNYLALPDTLPARVRDLAARLAVNQPTPYDQVIAIQDYLRQFPYSLKVPGVPTNRDVADYFLFDLQKGYCDYFATTMVVMVRAIGIPARLVTGFASGTYDYNAQRFVVVQADAHSWVEVYFPTIGWVEFEPTSNLPPFPRPGETALQNTPVVSLPTPVLPPGSRGIPINWSVLRPSLKGLEFVLVGLAVLLLFWLFLPLESWLLALRPAERTIPAIHQRLYRLGRSLGVSADAARTPHEFARVFSIRLERFAANQRLAPTVAALRANVNGLTELYARLLFSAYSPTKQEKQAAIRNWASIRKGVRKIRHY